MTPHDWKRIAQQRRKEPGVRAAKRETINSTYKCKRCSAKVTVNHQTPYQKPETVEEAMKRRRVPEDCDEMVVKQVMEL